MGDVSALQRWAGTWRGESKLWVDGAAALVSRMTMSVPVVADGLGTKVVYSWDYYGVPQAGKLAFVEDRGELDVRWEDSWHTGDKGMTLAGSVGEGGVVELMGHYAAPPGADWGWRITLGAERDGLVMRMFNVSPAGEAALAVEAVCVREYECTSGATPTRGL
jgi:hypothetical protein